MFMLRSTHHQIVDEITAGANIVIQSKEREIAELRAQLVHQPKRGAGGRFTKREQGK